MQDYRVELASVPSRSFRSIKAANSVDLDSEKKSQFALDVKADLTSPFQVGLICGNSGSGKSSLARQVWGADAFAPALDPEKALIDQFPESMSYDDVAEILGAVGLAQVPCWIRPAKTLSNGQSARAQVAIALAAGRELVVIDEWTSVVDRTVAKIMSHRVQKFVRGRKMRIVLVSCHYDVADWLLPDWVVDCTTAEFDDRRSLQQRRSETLGFSIAPATRESWRSFSHFHYLSERIPPEVKAIWGLFTDAGQQIGFVNFACYVPNDKTIVHANRLVVHPDYTGMGLSRHLLNVSAAEMSRRGFEVMIKFSALPVYHLLNRDANWRLADCNIFTSGGTRKGNGRARQAVRWWSYRYMGWQKRSPKADKANTGSLGKSPRPALTSNV